MRDKLLWLFLFWTKKRKKIDEKMAPCSWLFFVVDKLCEDKNVFFGKRIFDLSESYGLSLKVKDVIYGIHSIFVNVLHSF